MRSERLVLMPGPASMARARYPATARTLDDHLAAVPLPDEPFVLVAESFSGPLAISLAARRPASLRALILIATFTRVPHSLLVRAMALVPWTMGLAPRAATRRVLLGAAPDRALATLLAETLSTVPSATIGARLELLAALDLEVSLSVPVLAIEARHDWLVPRSVTRALAADLRAPLVTIDGPHLVLQRSPAAVASAIETFLESH